MRCIYTIVTIVLVCGSCAGRGRPSEAELDRPTDYSVYDNWLNLPDGGGRPHAVAAPVDVFFLYPTCFFTEGDRCLASDPGMRQEARFLREAHFGIFGGTNIYAPFYRQLSIGYISKLARDEGRAGIGAAIQKTPVTDAVNAFRYYLDNCDRGRPLIFAAHSQGSMALSFLILWIRGNRPDVLERTIAVYLVGFPVTDEYLDAAGLPFASSADDTGVIISYNTELPGAGFNPFTSLSQKIYVINPVNWRRDETPAAKTESLGSRVRFNRNAPVLLPAFAGAYLDLERGSVVTDADLIAESPWPEGVLHRYDYDLFYENLRENVAVRIAAWNAGK